MSTLSPKFSALVVFSFAFSAFAQDAAAPAAGTPAAGAPNAASPSGAAPSAAPAPGRRASAPRASGQTPGRVAPPAPPPLAPPQVETTTAAPIKNATVPGAANGTTSPSSGTKGPWTLASSIQHTLDVNPTLLKNRERLNEASANVGVAFAHLLPTVTSTIDASIVKEAPNSAAAQLFQGNSHNAYQFLIQANQPLFHHGTLAAYQASQKSVDLAKYDLQIAENQVIQDVFKAFYGILFAQRRYEILLQLQNTLKESLGVTERKFRIGTARELDVLQVRTQLSIQQPLIEQAQTNIQISAAQLASLLGEHDDPAITVRGSLNVPNWDRALARIRDKRRVRPELERIDLQREVLDLNQELTMGNHWPTLAAVGQWGRSGVTKSDLFDGSNTAWSLGLQLSIPLFSGLSSFQDRKALASQRAQLEQDRAALVNQLTLEIVRTDRDLDVKRQVIDSSEKAAAIAQQAYSVARRTYNFGTSTFFQLTQSQQDLLNAQLNLEQARYDTLVAMLSYFIASGWPIQDLIAILNQP